MSHSTPNLGTTSTATSTPLPTTSLVAPKMKTTQSQGDPELHPSLLDQPGLLRCCGCGFPMNDSHKIPVYNSLHVKRDYLRRPLAYDRDLPEPLELTDAVWCTPGCLRRHAKRVPILPEHVEDHYMTVMFQLRHRLPKFGKPDPPLECLMAYQATGTGLTFKQRRSLAQEFPDVLVVYQRYPGYRPILPGETNAVETKNHDFLRYYRIQELPSSIQSLLLSKSSPTTATETLPRDPLVTLDNDPDSDEDTCLHQPKRSDIAFTVKKLDGSPVTTLHRAEPKPTTDSRTTRRVPIRERRRK